MDQLNNKNMITEYKVIKPFSGLVENTIMTFNEETKKYEAQNETSTENSFTSTFVSINQVIAENYEKAGLLEAHTKDSVDNNAEAKLKELSNLIARLKNTYNQRRAALTRKFEEGKVQNCVKVEHDTVYFNLMKLLTKIEDIINE